MTEWLSDFWLHQVLVTLCGFSLVVASGGYSLGVVCRLLIAAASPVVEPGHLDMRASVVVVHGLSCPVACGIFLDQAWNPGPPALASGVLTTGSPWRSQDTLLSLFPQLLPPASSL